MLTLVSIDGQPVSSTKWLVSSNILFTSDDPCFATDNGSKRSAVLRLPENILEEPQVKCSDGRIVPKRNPKAKAWVSPYGGKRK